MASLRQKVTMASELATFMIEEGKVITQNEYRALRGPVPLSFVKIRKNFGTWDRCFIFLKKVKPDLWMELENLDNPKVEAPIIDLSAIEEEDEYLEG
jgi:hypothetical protein